MPRRAEDHEFVLPMRGADTPLQRWLYEEIRSAILTGRLQTGARLPATRDLAEQYGIARGTVTIAFEQLAAEGYLITMIGRGTFVERSLPEASLRPPPEALAGTSEARAPTPAKM